MVQPTFRFAACCSLCTTLAWCGVRRVEARTGALRCVALSGHERYRHPKRDANHIGCKHGAAHCEAEHQ